MRIHFGPTSLVFAALMVLVGAAPRSAAQAYAPAIKPASTEGTNAIRKFKWPSDLRTTLFAAEPDLANPVAFCIDTKGRIFIAETFRLHKGVTDNREHKNWIDDELACRTVADRVKMYEQKFAKDIADWKTEHERVRMVEDTDGDGVADRSPVFADGFKELPDGIGAGLLAYEGRLYYTCIPKLWLLEDVDADGRADQRRVLHDGFGVHTALLGHDLHGLRIGPDGRLYFSIGDRGCHVVTPERTISFPDEGAVFRCNLDGSGLEVVHRGLRNPQELAFDKFGNLFTGDNNSDGGDKARWVYVVEGGHSGWQIGYQSLSDRGPWNREKLWHPHFNGQAAYIVPPITNLINGPSGLTYDPGVGLPARYRDHFFLCEFRGMSSMSGIVALKVEPKGASFELTDKEEFFWKILPTDVEFGFDGALYILDWTEGWGQPMKGRVYRVASPESARDPIVAQAARLMRDGTTKQSDDDLVALLSHADQRVRQEAQFTLVRRGRVAALQGVAAGLERRMARIHAIWGLDQIGRQNPDAVRPLLELSADSDHEIRAQVAKVLGQCRIRDAEELLIGLLQDRSSRVRFFAAISLGQLGSTKAVEPLLAMLRADDQRDPYLRHAGVMGLSGVPDRATLLGHVDDESRAARMGVLLALRRRDDPGVAEFFDDADPRLVLAAARAVHDVPIESGMAQLARLLTRPSTVDENLVRRCINANFRVGDAVCLARVARYAARQSAPTGLRAIALDAIRHWAKPPGRDRVLNCWRPLPQRDPKPVVTVIAPVLPGLLRNGHDEVRVAAVGVVEAYQQRRLAPILVDIVADGQRSGKLRKTALEALKALDWDELEASARLATEAESAVLRKTGVRILAHLRPQGAVPLLNSMIDGEAPLGERQNAIAVLGELRIPEAEAVLSRRLDDLLAGRVPPPLRLDVMEAAAAAKQPALETKLAQYRRQRNERVEGDPVGIHAEALHGGDKGRGEQVFWQREDATSCKKCHSIHGWGGNAGPDLTDVGKRLSREQLLTALLDPNREIAHGYGTFVYTLDDDSVVAGMVQKETDGEILLEDANGDQFRVQKKRIQSRSEPASAMPPMVGLLNRRELRDLVEFLKQDKKKRE